MTANNDTQPKRRRGPGKPFKPGQSGNPDGVPKAMLELRAALQGDAPRIHAALMRLVEEGNPQAVIYAHQRVFGKPPAAPEDRAQEDAMVTKLSDAIKRNDTEGLLAAYAFLTREQK